MTTAAANVTAAYIAVGTIPTSATRRARITGFKSGEATRSRTG